MKRTTQITLALSTFAMLASYNNCMSNFKSKNDISSSLSACERKLSAVFSSTWHPFFRANCSACHAGGGVGNGQFASSNVSTAFSQFMLRNSALFEQKGSDSHGSPYTGAQNVSSLQALRSGWTAPYNEYLACKADLSNPPNLGKPAHTKPILISATTTYKTLTYNLDADIATSQVAAGKLVGASITLEIHIITEGGTNKYEIRNVRVKAGDQPLRFRSFKIALNGTVVGTFTTYEFVDRWVSAGNTRTALNQSVSSVVFNIIGGSLIPPAANDTLAIYMGSLEDVEFSPPRLQDLVNASGTFGANCVSCHSGGSPSGGFTITNYAQLTANSRVIAFSPEQSQLYSRMTTNMVDYRMPPSGNLGNPDVIKEVKDWILDGAPNN